MFKKRWRLPWMWLMFQSLDRIYESEMPVSDIKRLITANGKNVERKADFSKYFAALRPWSFTASFTPVALGSALAYERGFGFDFSIFITTCLTALSVHAAGNLVNTYFDYFRGIDSKKSDDRTLVNSVLSPADVAWLGGVFYVLGCCGFVILTLISPARMEHLALVYFGGLSSSFLYTGGLGLKYMALGDLVVFLTFGPISVMFAFLSQAGTLALNPLLYAIPLALNTEAILHSNNFRDAADDREAGIVTLAIMLGSMGSYILYCLLLFLPYIIFIYLGLHWAKWYFLPVLTIFESFKLERHFRRGELRKLPQKVAKLNFILGQLYVVACIITAKSKV